MVELQRTRNVVDPPACPGLPRPQSNRAVAASLVHPPSVGVELNLRTVLTTVLCDLPQAPNYAVLLGDLFNGQALATLIGLARAATNPIPQPLGLVDVVPLEPEPVARTQEWIEAEKLSIRRAADRLNERLDGQSASWNRSAVERALKGQFPRGPAGKKPSDSPLNQAWADTVVAWWCALQGAAGAPKQDGMTRALLDALDAHDSDGAGDLSEEDCTAELEIVFAHPVPAEAPRPDRLAERYAAQLVTLLPRISCTGGQLAALGTLRATDPAPATPLPARWAAVAGSTEDFSAALANTLERARAGLEGRQAEEPDRQERNRALDAVRDCERLLAERTRLVALGKVPSDGPPPALWLAGVLSDLSPDADGAAVVTVQTGG
jgi:hypothetical protein